MARWLRVQGVDQAGCRRFDYPLYRGIWSHSIYSSIDYEFEPALSQTPLSFFCGELFCLRQGYPALET